MVLKLKSIIILFIKGILIGGSMMVPGVSGGSMAIVFGIYSKLINSVADFFKNKLKSIIILSVFGLGGILGIIILSNPLSYLIANFPFVTAYFFFGACIGGIPYIIKKSEITFKIKDYAPMILAALLVLFISLIPNFSFNYSFFSFIIAGFLGSIALVLPGISLSFMLLIFGIYDKLLYAINNFDLNILIPFFLSVILGIFCFSKIINICLTRYKKLSFSIILGFVIGSLCELFPGIPNLNNILPSLISLACGIYFINLLSKFEE